MNDNRKGMVYKKSTMIFDDTDGLFYDNSRQFAQAIGVSKEAVFQAINEGRNKCKGHFFTVVSRDFYNDFIE